MPYLTDENGKLLTKEGKALSVNIPQGTQLNPVRYVDGMEPVEKTFYKKDGKTHLYIGGEFVEW